LQEEVSVLDVVGKTDAEGVGGDTERERERERERRRERVRGEKKGREGGPNLESSIERFLPLNEPLTIRSHNVYKEIHAACIAYYMR
jgi:hypothetical protein